MTGRRFGVLGFGIDACDARAGHAPMVQDFRVAFRSLRGSRWYAGTTVAVLAGGIALTTLTFAIVDGVLFKPLPYRRCPGTK